MLIVDDSADSRVLLKNVLEKRDYVCHLASSGDEALEVLASQAIDLALVDIVMPGMSGLILFQHVKELYPDVAVIFVTAMDDLNLAVEYLKNGAYDYMVKPVAPAHLQEMAEEALEKRKAALGQRLLEEESALYLKELKGKVQELSALNRILRSDLVDGLVAEEEIKALRPGGRGTNHRSLEKSEAWQVSYYPLVPADGRMLTISEAACLLNAHPNSVRRWADIGLLPSYRLGSRGDRRFKPEDVADFLDSWKGQ